MGDAVGVPVEFMRRETIRQNPVIDMVGYGTYNLPPGTWSDDSSLTFCLAEALTHEFNLVTIGNNFINWYHNAYWTATGNVFDIGITTRFAIKNLAKGIRPDLAGGFNDDENGNGSLMRILPLVFYIKHMNIHERYTITKQVSSITHGHIRSVIACFYYLEFARQLLTKTKPVEIYQNLQSSIPEYLTSISINPDEIELFHRVFKNQIAEQQEEKIYSSGYVLHTLEASIWCLLKTNSYSEAVLKAVNLGEDTDTTAAVTGGLAGILYGFDDIRVEWYKKIMRSQDIEDLAHKLATRLK